MTHAEVLPDPENSAASQNDEAFFMHPHEHCFLNPYLTAEQFPADVLARSPVGNNPLSSIWNAVETGISSQDAQLVHTARDEASTVAADTLVSSLTRVKASMLIATAGLLAFRASSELFQRNDIQQAAKAMGQTLYDMRNGRFGVVNESQLIGCHSEMAVYYLIARRGGRKNVPYLGSLREEDSNASEANHDIYTLYRRAEPTNKVPFQIKSSKKQARGFVGVLRLRQVLGETDLPEKYNELSIHKLGELITDEVQEQLPQDDERRIALDALSSKIIEKTSNHRLWLRRTKAYNKWPYTVPTTAANYRASF